MLRLLFLLLLAPLHAAEEFVPRMAVEARLFLRVPDEAVPLRDVRVSAGEVSAGSFEGTPEKQERLSDVRFPVRWWAWRELTIRFTPGQDGAVELDLNGPWGEARPGVLLQQEVLWDEIRATGAELVNGNFEQGLAGWESPWRAYPEAMKGKGFGASWHGRPLIGKLQVKAGVPVVLKLNARAATTPGFKAPAILGNATPAHRACALLKRGVNLGNGWEAAPGTWGLKYEMADIDRIAAEGFDHIRVPVAWHHYIVNGAIKPEFLADFDPLLKHALEKKLSVIVNWHNYEGLCKEPEQHRAVFVAGWGVLARHFRDWPPQLYLELFNEPNGALDHEVLTAVHAQAIAAIRKVDAERILLADPPQWAGVSGLDRFFLPDGDDRIIVSVHSYEPFQFTHQGAAWVGYQDLRGISYPGPPLKPVAVPESLKENAGLVAWLAAYNTKEGSDNPCAAATFELLLDDALAWSAHFGRPVHAGEFGAVRNADAASRGRYVRDFRMAAEKRKIPWTMWDWKAGFAYWDGETGKALLREELFGR
ncbi:glycoside hydrolase family 5 protein [Luteolibacter sp. Populi]|uniref:glycoside hydrolase family 5 protein n=1 Tax=Luteolibacter sp. Populi TaxID=3230487 RepID=UPI00346715D7